MITRHNLVQEAYDLIRDDILALRFKPGDKINVSAVARSVDLSLSPFREALNRLAKGGLVRHVPSRGYYVFKPTTRDIKELFQLRALSEIEALSDFSSGASARHKQGLGKLRARMIDLTKEKNERKKLRQFQKIDEEFHRMILQISDNVRLRALFSQISDLIILTQRLDDQALHTDIYEPSREHLLITDALLKDKVSQAKRLLRSHIFRTRERLLKPAQGKSD